MSLAHAVTQASVLPAWPRRCTGAVQSRPYCCIAAPSSAVGRGSPAPQSSPRELWQHRGDRPWLSRVRGLCCQGCPTSKPQRTVGDGDEQGTGCLLARGSQNYPPRTLVLCQGVSCKDSGKHQGVQTFQFPEPNVSGLSCWFCHLFPWKSGLCTLLQPLLLLYQPGDPGSAIPSPPGSSHHSCGFLLHPQRFLGVHLP